MKFEVAYYIGGEFSHKYEEEWLKTDLFCPSCGENRVYDEQGMGDYYVGPQFLCAACGASFFLPFGPEERPDDTQDVQRLYHIRTGGD
jgi:transposase-like protein